MDKGKGYDDMIGCATCSLISRLLTVDFIFIFSLLFSFSFSFIFYFLFLEQLRLGFISHAVTLVTS